MVCICNGICIYIYTCRSGFSHQTCLLSVRKKPCDYIFFFFFETASQILAEVSSFFYFFLPRPKKSFRIWLVINSYGRHTRGYREECDGLRVDKSRNGWRLQRKGTVTNQKGRFFFWIFFKAVFISTCRRQHHHPLVVVIPRRRKKKIMITSSQCVFLCVSFGSTKTNTNKMF